MPKINYLTSAEVNEINTILGCRGTISEGNLEFVLEKIIDTNTSVERKAVTLLYELIISHPFLDCNKRTAFVSMQIFLKRNRKKLKYSEINEEILKRLLYDIAENKISYKEAENVLTVMIV